MGVDRGAGGHHRHVRIGAVIVAPAPDSTLPGTRDGAPSRDRADLCPGLLRPHYAADGALIRLRLPGGRIQAEQLLELATAAAEFGDGHIHLTSRGNVQLRGIAADQAGVLAALSQRVIAAGLLPSDTHELIRNISCSPLTGRLGGRADLSPLIADLDAQLCATAELAQLPGRFLFALDDGSGDVFPLSHDLGVLAVCPHQVQLTYGGQLGPIVGLAQAVGLLIALAVSFVRLRGVGPQARWHVHELADGGARLFADLTFLAPACTCAASCASQEQSIVGTARLIALGLLDQRDGRVTVSAAVPLARLSFEQTQATVLAATQFGSGQLVLTPWRGLLLPDVENAAAAEIARNLSEVGLTMDPDSGWRSVSACTGAPWCSKADGQTHPIAVSLAHRASRSAALPVHVVGCPRRCGSPAAEHVEVLTTGTHLLVTHRNGDLETVQRAENISDLSLIVDRARNSL